MTHILPRKDLNPEPESFSEGAGYTPGPWQVTQTILGWSVATKDRIPIAASDIGPEYKNFANAQLIAASPDMYALLKRFVARRDADVADLMLDADIRALLRRVKGETE